MDVRPSSPRSRRRWAAAAAWLVAVLALWAPGASGQDGAGEASADGQAPAAEQVAVHELLAEGLTLYNQSDFAGAEARLRAVVEGLPGPDDPRGREPVIVQWRGLAEMHLGGIAREHGRHDEAEARLGRALADLATAGRPEWEAFALFNLAETRLDAGRPVEAQLPIEVGLIAAIEAGDAHTETLLWGLAARMWSARGDSERARKELDAGLERAESTGDPLHVVLLLHAQAEWFLDRGEWDAADAAASEALELSDEPYAMAVSHGLRGDACQARGDLAEALGAYDLVRAIGVEVGDRHLVAQADTSLAIVEQFMDQHERARERLESAIAVFSELGDTENQRVAETQLAAGWLATGELTRAAGVAERMIGETARVGDREHEAAAMQLLWLARRGAADTDELAALCESRLEHARRSGLPIAEAIARTDRALLALEARRFDDARRDAEAAADLYARSGTTDRLAEALVLAGRAALGQRDVAGTASSLAGAEAALGRAAMERLSVEQASRVRAREDVGDLGELYQDLVALRLQGVGAEAPVRDEIVRDGFAAAGRFKGRALLEGMANRWTEADEEVEHLRMQRRLSVVDSVALSLELRAATVNGLPLEEVDDLRVRLEGKRAEAIRLGQQLSRSSPRAAGLDVPLGVDPARVLADAVGPSGVLVEFAEGSERLFAYVLDEDGLRFLDLGPKVERGAEVESYLALISDPASLAPPWEVAELGARLFESLLSEPLGDHAHAAGEAPRRVAIVPSPVVAPLPFEALVTEAPDDPTRFAQVTFVIDGHEVNYAPSSPVLAMLAQLGPREDPGRMLLLGDPLYTAAGADRLRSATDEPRQPWPALPGTRDETFDVAGLVASLSGRGSDVDLEAFRRRDGGVVDEEGFRLLFGAEATSEALRGDLSEFDILHVAGHGWVDLARPERSGLALSPRGEDDGALLLHDILELDLDLRLAVLSACQTGRGRVRRGEGVQSLVRAFFFAGARSVVASMWQVDDVETAHTMREFYEGLLRDELAPGAALHRARLAVRHAADGPDRFLATGRRRGDLLPGEKADEAEKKRQNVGHPYFWAGFVYVGRAVD